MMPLTARTIALIVSIRIDGEPKPRQQARHTVQAMDARSAGALLAAGPCQLWLTSGHCQGADGSGVAVSAGRREGAFRALGRLPFEPRLEHVQEKCQHILLGQLVERGPWLDRPLLVQGTRASRTTDAPNDLRWIRRRVECKLHVVVTATVRRKSQATAWRKSRERVVLRLQAVGDKSSHRRCDFLKESLIGLFGGRRALATLLGPLPGGFDRPIQSVTDKGYFHS